MNKRLEQEFNNFIDRLAIKESLAEGVPPSMFDLQRVAEHFYSLALADVRGEVEKRKAANEHFHLDEKVNEDVHILYFIGNLTK